MNNSNLYILVDDKKAALDRIAELEKAIQDLGPEFYDVFNQSSETWHDNAPFDALRDRQSVLAAELQSLKSVINRAEISLPRINKNKVGIGASVTVYIEALSKEQRFFVAGDWTYRTGEEKSGALIVSAKSPIAQTLMGRKVGETAHFKNDMVIQAITYEEPLK